MSDFVFVFSDFSIVHQNVEVQGMDMVRVLHGHQSEGNGVETLYVPSFPSECPQFVMAYNLHADISGGLWSDVFCSVCSPLTQQLCRIVQSQGIDFCSKQSAPLKIDRWKWNWMKEFFLSKGREHIRQFTVS